MSELRDLALALAAISKSLTSIEEHTAAQVANGEQLRIGMHDLRDKLQVVVLERTESDRTVKQIETWLSDYGKKLGMLTDDVGFIKTRLEMLTDDVVKGFRDDRRKLRELADAKLKEGDEVTRV